MNPFLKYWMFVRLNPGGGYRKREVAQVKLFFQQQFPQSVPLTTGEIDSASESAIQRQLVTLSRTTDSPDLIHQQFLAKFCLRCFISNQILQVCQQLATQFGPTYGFDCNDLLPYVLTDDLNTGSKFVSLGSEILETFDPDQSNLATWTSRKVKHHRALNAFLLEHGVYLISDWAILNDTKPRQLERILTEFHQLTVTEVQQLINLLQSYHQVYRADRLQQRSRRSNQPCLPPSETQLQRIAQLLPGSPRLPPYRLLSQLQGLAERVRLYRIQARGGKRQQTSLDDHLDSSSPENLITPPFSLEDEEQTEFLAAFRQSFTKTLEQAIAQATQARLTQLQAKNPPKALDFLTALELFHCQGQAMGAIAPQIGLKHQWQVSRLLTLDRFRAAVRRQMILVLRDACLVQAGISLHPERLHALDAALEELIGALFQEAEAEVSHAKGAPLRSRFAHSLCQYLCQILPD